MRRHYGVRTARYKLIHFYEEDVNEWELYDLQEDPHELQSVYGDPHYQDVVDSLKSELERLRQQYHDDGSVAEFPKSVPPRKQRTKRAKEEMTAGVARSQTVSPCGWGVRVDAASFACRPVGRHLARPS